MIEQLKEKISKSIFIINLFSIEILLLTILYRSEIHTHIEKIYGQQLKLTLFEYILKSLKEDIPVMAFMIAVIVTISIALINYKKLKYTLLTCFVIIVSTFYFVFSNFFESYQTAFHVDFVGSEHFSNLPAVFGSIANEASTVLLFKIATSFILFIYLSVRLYRNEDRVAGKKISSKKIMPLLLSYMIILWLFAMFTGPLFKNISTTGEKAELANELCANPYANFLKKKSTQPRKE